MSGTCETSGRPDSAGQRRVDARADAAAVDIAIVCSDFDASLDFYHRVVGLPIHEDLEIPEYLAVPSGLAPSSFRHVRLRAGASLIKLMQISPAPDERTPEFSAGVRWLTFQVSNLQETVNRLQSRGVKFLSEPIRGLAGLFACAEAPDGLILEFVERFTDPRDGI